MNDNEFMSASDMILRVVKNLDPQRLQEGKKVFSLWRQIVESIKSNSINGANIGKNMASHSHIVDLQNGILLVEADHPGWIQMLGNYKKYILKGFSLKAPELKIDTLAFKLAGTNFELSGFNKKIEEEKIREREEKKLEKEQIELEKQGFVYKSSEEKTGKKSNLPPEIQKMFDSIKSDMLKEN